MLPGLSLPDEVQGKTGYELLSAAALAASVKTRAAELELPPDAPDLLRRFDACFTASSIGSWPSVSSPTKRAARGILEEYGQNLGFLLVTLKRGDPENRAARLDWDDRHWAWWGKINTIWLGGGLVSGYWGPLIADTAQTIVQNAGFPEYAVHISPHGGNISLAGAARLVPDGFNSALVFDFGHTQVKRAVAHLHSDNSVQMEPMPPMPAPCERYEYHGWAPEKSPQVLDEMVTAVAETWSAAIIRGYVLDPIIVLSLACYLRDGHPIPAHLETGCYARLQVLSINLERLMNNRISDVLGRAVQVKLVHDATAAALAYTGWRETAVITMGTSLGIGFPPPDL